MSDSLRRLHLAVLDSRSRDPATSRTAKLFADGLPKMAKKVAEEAVELSLEALQGDRRAAILESADLIYNLTVLWAALEIDPADIWEELDRRERLYGMAEKLRKGSGSSRAKAPRSRAVPITPLPR